jgi:hypothetical protein
MKIAGGKPAFILDCARAVNIHTSRYVTQNIKSGKEKIADLPKSPVMLNPQFKGAQPIDVLSFQWAGGQTAHPRQSRKRSARKRS